MLTGRSWAREIAADTIIAAVIAVSITEADLHGFHTPWGYFSTFRCESQEEVFSSP